MEEEFVDYEVVRAIASATNTLVDCIRMFIREENLQPETVQFLSYCIVCLIHLYQPLHKQYLNLKLEKEVFWDEEDEKHNEGE